MRFDRLISRVWRGIVFFPKTAYINFRVLPFREAIQFPIIVMGRTGFKGIHKRSIVVSGEIRTGMIRIAAQKTSKRGLPVNKKTWLIADNGGVIRFDGRASVGAGTSICASGGEIELGDAFSCNINCFIYSHSAIRFGEDVLLGWNINIRDNDGHPMYDSEGNLTNPDGPIRFGNRVWIASYVDVMKNVSIADGTIIGTRSLVTRSVEEPNAVVAGVPAKIIKRGVFWQHN